MKSGCCNFPSYPRVKMNQTMREKKQKRKTQICHITHSNCNTSHDCCWVLFLFFLIFFSIYRSFLKWRNWHLVSLDSATRLERRRSSWNYPSKASETTNPPLNRSINPAEEALMARWQHLAVSVKRIKSRVCFQMGTREFAPLCGRPVTLRRIIGRLLFLFCVTWRERSRKKKGGRKKKKSLSPIWKSAVELTQLFKGSRPLWHTSGHWTPSLGADNK